MAHRSNVISVLKDPVGNLQSEKVTDPVCGMVLTKKDSRSVLFRENDTFYFCSRDCQQKFLNPKKKTKAAA
jgi:YHS domain-containing protein